jgi:superfamily II DNA/RNA helicase
MTETTGSELTPDHAQAQTPPDNQIKPTSVEPPAGETAEIVVAPVSPTPADPAELPAVSREVRATRLLDQPTPAPDDDSVDVSGSADPASVGRARSPVEPDLAAPSESEAVEVVAVPVAREPEPEPEPVPTNWDELELPPTLRTAIDALGWAKPTPVQARTFPTMVAGSDALVQSQTGSGKTGAFCLPWLASRFERGPAKITGVQLIVLLPTRELAKQVCDELVRLATDTPVAVLPVYGGTAMSPQLDALSRGVHAVVGTPGRILDHIRRRSLDLSKVRTVVLDECDEMLSMGFLEDIRSILSACPSERQTCLFSATVPREIERIARRHMRDPIRIALSGDEIAAAEISHAYYSTGNGIKTRDLLDVIILEDPSSAIVFCNTREETRLVANVLQKNGYSAEALSSDLTQASREKVMGKFRDRELRFLVATDVAARGIDVSHVSHVINFSFPEAAEVYVHRTGRTGRAGRAGTALSIVSPLEIGSFYTLTKSYKSIQFTERKLPATNELAATRTEVKLDRISHDYSEPVSPEWLLLARRLIEDPRGERVVAYLLHEAIESERFAKHKPLTESEETSEEVSSEQPIAEYRERERGRGRGRDDRRGGDRDRGRGRDRDRDRRGRDGDRDRNRDRDRDRRGGRPGDRADFASRPGDRADFGPRSGDRAEGRPRRRDRRDEESTEIVETREDVASRPADVETVVELDEDLGPIGAGESGSEDDVAEGGADSEDRPRRRRRRRRRRKPMPGEQDEQSVAAEPTADVDERRESDDEDDEDDEDDRSIGVEADAESEDEDEDEDRPKKRRRRKRRRGRGSPAAAAPASVEQPAATAEPDRKKRRRRRRRGKSSDDGNGETETETDTETEVEVVEENTRVSQDEIIIDIDEQELTAVRDEFGEIDEFDELTLKGRRRAVLEDLTEEMEVEDLTDRDAEDEDEDELESESESELESEPEATASPEATPVSDEASASEAQAEATPSEQEDAGRKKKRRRRRRKKTPPPTPELTCPPHKDFWEVWAAKFSAKDFQRDEDSKDTDETVEDEPPTPVAVVVEAEPDSELPLIEDAPDEDTLVRVGLNIGRRHGHKAAHVRALLRRLTGLHGKAVKDLTVRDTSSLFRMDVRHFETVVRRLDGSVVEEVTLTLVQLGEDSDLGEDGELPALRVPERPVADVGASDEPADEIAAAPEDA